MNRTTVPQSEKRKEKWTLLLVSETGKTLRIKWFKGMILIILVSLLAAVSAAGTFYYLYEAEIRENEFLRSALTGGNQRPESANIPVSEPEEKGSPTAVSPETSIAENRDGIPEIQAVHPLENPPRPDGENGLPLKRNETEQSFLVPAPESEEEAVFPESPMPLRVAIEDFEYAAGNRNDVYVRYKIKKTDPESRSISGHAVVVLEGEEEGKPRWLALPDVNLVSGIPTGQEEGQPFSISNYKYMKFRPKDPFHPDRFSGATLYVFDETGALLLKQNRSLAEDSDTETE